MAKLTLCPKNYARALLRFAVVYKPFVPGLIPLILDQAYGCSGTIEAFPKKMDT